VPDGGALKILDKLLAAYGNTLVMGLTKTDITPASGDTASTYTAHEADFSGYARQTITTWGASTTVSGRATATATALTWTNSTGATGNNVYTYFVLDGSGNLLWAERDATAPIDMGSAGRSYTITPTLTDKSEF